MSNRPQGSRVLFARLTVCTSAAGRQYLRGYAGASNLVGFRAEDDEEGRPVFDLFLAERVPPTTPRQRTLTLRPAAVD